MLIKQTEAQFLSNWEDVYKKGLLTFWLLLFLHQRPAYAYEAGAEVERLSQGTVHADENSIYRALNRFESLGLAKSELRESEIGPKRRYYSLSRAGSAILAGFINRNILVFDNPAVRNRIQAVLLENPAGKESSE
ncbi:MAG: PadR family transcriptional regulator [Anaerolineales bacterium]|nr:PadR family transcriptional regulator [Anaerolineales bacterium]